MAFEAPFQHLLQTTDDANLEKDDPAPTNTYDLKLTIFFGAIVLLAMYAWCLNCLDRELSEDKEKHCTSEKGADGLKEKADDVRDSSNPDISSSQDQPPAMSNAEVLGQGIDSDEDSLESEGWRVVR